MQMQCNNTTSLQLIKEKFTFEVLIHLQLQPANLWFDSSSSACHNANQAINWSIDTACLHLLPCQFLSRFKIQVIAEEISSSVCLFTAARFNLTFTSRLFRSHNLYRDGGPSASNWLYSRSHPWITCTLQVGTVSVHTCFGNLQIRLSSLSVVSVQLYIPNALLMTKFNTAHRILTYRRGGSRSASDWLHSVGGQESPAHFLQILALLSINQRCNRISRRSITFSNFLLFTAPLRSSDLDLSAAGFYLHSTCSSYAH